MVLFSALEGECYFFIGTGKRGAIFIFHRCMFGEAYAPFRPFSKTDGVTAPGWHYMGLPLHACTHDILTHACERHESHPNFFRESIIVGQMLD